MKVSYGRTIGHGVSCAKGHLCDQCSTIEALEALIVTLYPYIRHKKDCLAVGLIPCSCGYVELIIAIKVAIQ